MERKLTAILCADVHGYSRLMGEDEEATLRTLTSHRKLIDSQIEQHHGRFVNSAGDSVLAEFASVVEEEYVHLKIEAEATGHQVFSFPPSPRIFTREPGDLLWESREGPFEIRRQKAVMGKWKYAAQYQQDPIPEGGSIFQREWFSHRFHRDPATGLPLGAKLRMVIQNWD